MLTQPRSAANSIRGCRAVFEPVGRDTKSARGRFLPGDEQLLYTRTGSVFTADERRGVAGKFAMLGLSGLRKHAAAI